MDIKTNIEMQREENIKRAGYFFVNAQATIRKTAQEIGMSKTWTYNAITKHLVKLDPKLYEEALEVLMKNKRERHLRGGNVNKIKAAANK